jgi:MFS family permease
MVRDNNFGYLLWNSLALFLSYLAVAMPLPLMSVFVTRELGFSNSLGGLAVGISFFATICARGYAGGFSDRKGGKACMQWGLLLYAAASLFCLAAIQGQNFNHLTAYVLLLAGRALLGLGESMTLVGMLSWNISLMGAARSGVVFSTVGALVYGSIAVGGLAGFTLVERAGFPVMMLACIPLPLLGLAMIKGVPETRPRPALRKESFFKVIGLVWRQGSVVGFQGVGFAALGAFITLYFASQGWPHAGLGMTCFGVGFVLLRMLCGRLPDRFGGKTVALISLGVEAGGQLLLALAPAYEIALLGAFLTGAGCAMVYPSMGVEVIRMMPEELRGIAVGGFAIFQDIAYGMTAPLAGILADYFGYAAVFILGLASALAGLVLALSLTPQQLLKPDKKEPA